MHRAGTHHARVSPAIDRRLVRCTRTTALLVLVLAATFTASYAARAYGRLDAGSLVRAAGSRDAAYLIMRPIDCEGSVALLRLFDREPIARRIAMLGVLLVGASALEADSLRRLLTGIRPDLAVRPASRTERRTLGALGLRPAPFLVVLESGTGALRFASVPPRSVRAELALTRILTEVASAP